MTSSFAKVEMVVIGTKDLTSESSPYIIAEIGVNHEGCLHTAKKLIDLAAEGGAHAAKFQSYKASSLAAKHSPSYWDTSMEACTSQYQLFSKYDNFNEEDYISLYDHCSQVGISFLSTPFDAISAEFLLPMMDCYKISSSDITNYPLIRQIAKYNKPIFLSTGASTLDEIHSAVDELTSHGASYVVLLHCILNYPTINQNAHLGMITSLKDSFPELLVGYSDHTLPDRNMTSLVTAFMLGAVVIEKHFTHDKSLPGNDHYHSMDVHDLKRFVNTVKDIRELRGPAIDKQPIATEAISRLNARRSLVAAKPLPRGHILASSDLIPKRPESGIPANKIDYVVGRKTLQEIPEDHILQWTDLSE